MTFEQIADCTDEQIAYVLFHPRDDEGRLKTGYLSSEDEGPSISFRGAVLGLWRRQFPEKTEEELLKRFEEMYPGA